MLFTAENTLEEVLDRVMREIHRGTAHPDHPFRFLSLGTQHDQAPSMRYVVLRETGENGDISVYTDIRSEKIRTITGIPAVALLFYHPRLRVQVRITGRAVVHHSDEVAARHWAAVPSDSRKAYASVVDPGSPITSPEQAHAWPAHIDDRNFAVIRIRPETMDVLQLQELSHVRAQFIRSENNWQGTWVAP